MRTAIVEIHKDELGFSAGHFTIFSATEREHLHGHNYNVSVALRVALKEDGLTFDYRHYKAMLREVCLTLNGQFLLAGRSPYLKLETQGEWLLAHFNQEKIPFLPKDVTVLPLANITIEELAHWFLEKVISNPDELKQHAISGVTVKVFNGPGQAGVASWGA